MKRELSFQSYHIYPNGIKVSSVLMEDIDTISGQPDADREYVNSMFMIMFRENVTKKRLKRGVTRKAVLDEYRDSKEYRTMKGDIFLHKLHILSIEYNIY